MAECEEAKHSDPSPWLNKTGLLREIRNLIPSGAQVRILLVSIFLAIEIPVLSSLYLLLDELELSQGREVTLWDGALRVPLHVYKAGRPIADR